MPSIAQLIRQTYRMARNEGSREVVNNAMFLSGLQIITFILPLVVVPYLFRVLGPAHFGLIAFAQAFASYFMIVTDYGFNISATRDVSLCRNEKDKLCEIFSAVMLAKIGLMVVSLLVFGAIVLAFPRFQNDWVLYAFCAGAIVGNALFPFFVFQGLEDMKHIANLRIFAEIANAVAIFSLVHRPEDYLWIPLIWSDVTIATGVVGIYIVVRRFGLRPVLPSRKRLRHQVKAGWNVFVSALAINAYTTTRVFAVGLFTNNTLTGFYSVAERIAGVVQTFPLQSFSQAVFPRLSKVFHHNKPRAFELMQHIQTITARISYLTLPLVFLASPWIIRVACGMESEEATLTLQLLVVSVLFVASNAFRVQFLLVAGRSRAFRQIHLTMALIGLPLLLLLVKMYSYVGAALATVIIEGGILLLTIVRIRKFDFLKK